MLTVKVCCLLVGAAFVLVSSSGRSTVLAQAKAARRQISGSRLICFELESFKP
ncbi:MAG TPA: hypothetical protein VIP98_09125 [Microlunatus sp.]